MITLKASERIYLIKRRHPIILFFEIFPLGITILILAGLMVYFAFFSFPPLVGDLLESAPFAISDTSVKFLMLFLLSFFVLVCWQIAAIITADYYLDCWVITNERTIHTELRGLFSRFYSSVSHNKIQDITVDIHGFLPTIFKYGDLKIQTAGAFKEFIFRQIPDPYKTKDVLLSVKEKE